MAVDCPPKICFVQTRTSIPSSTLGRVITRVEILSVCRNGPLMNRFCTSWPRGEHPKMRDNGRRWSMATIWSLLFNRQICRRSADEIRTRSRSKAFDVVRWWCNQLLQSHEWSPQDWPFWPVTSPPLNDIFFLLAAEQVSDSPFHSNVFLWGSLNDCWKHLFSFFCAAEMTSDAATPPAVTNSIRWKWAAITKRRDDVLRQSLLQFQREGPVAILHIRCHPRVHLRAVIREPGHLAASGATVTRQPKG